MARRYVINFGLQFLASNGKWYFDISNARLFSTEEEATKAMQTEVSYPPITHLRIMAVIDESESEDEDNE